MISRKHAGTTCPTEEWRRSTAQAVVARQDEEAKWTPTNPSTAPAAASSKSKSKNLIAMPWPMFICNECVELLQDIEQKRKTGDPVTKRNREVKLQELKI